MKWLKHLFSPRLYADLSDEIREHLEEKVEELVAGGMSRKEAAAAARREFGNVTLAEEDSRNVWRWPPIENFLMSLSCRLVSSPVSCPPGGPCASIRWWP